jgi:hypothetical protein
VGLNAVTTPRDAIALVACRVFEAEIATLAGTAPHIVRQEFFEMGLHDQPDVLRTRLNQAIARAETAPSVKTVVLVYGLCGRALVDLAPQRCHLVVARVHDCIGLLLGGNARHAECLHAEPGTYWYSPGWNRGRRVAGPERETKLRDEYTRKFGAEEAEALLEMERAAFAPITCAGYTDHRLPGDDHHRCYAEQCARSLGWRFDYHPGDPTLLRDLLHGPWDDARFLVVQPGERIAQSVDARVMQARSDLP